MRELEASELEDDLPESFFRTYKESWENKQKILSDIYIKPFLITDIDAPITLPESECFKISIVGYQNGF